MKQDNEQERDFEELYKALDELSEKYPEFFEALEALPPTELPIIIETGNTTTPYGEFDSAEFE